jgi:hypothetical protein
LANDIYAVVNANAVLHSTGNGAWDHQGLPSGDTFTGVWGSGPNDVYIYNGPELHSTGTGDWKQFTI